MIKTKNYKKNNKQENKFNIYTIKQCKIVETKRKQKKKTENRVYKQLPYIFT